MSGAASPYDAGAFGPPRARPRRARGARVKHMARAAAWQPAPLAADDLPQRRTDHGPLLDQRGRSLRVAADPLGLAIVGGHSDIHWSDVTRFVCRAYTSRHRGDGMRYSVLAGQRAITWDLPYGAGETMCQEHELLCRLIVSRTGLLLVEEGVVAPQWPIEMRAGRAVPLPDEAMSTRTRAPEPAPSRSGSCRGIWRRLGIFLVLVALAGAAAYAATMAIAQFGAQTVSPSALASTVQGASTLYYDALNLPDGDWPAGVLAGSGAAAAFRGHAYTLAAKAEPAAALAPGALGGDALAVTVSSVQGTGPAGLALRASGDGSALLVFAVAPNGRWLFARADATSGAAASLRTLASGATDLIQRGATAANTLLVIPRAGAYLCYVNGHYIGTVTPSSSATAGLPASGSAGVWAAAGTSAAFTSFAVYAHP